MALKSKTKHFDSYRKLADHIKSYHYEGIYRCNACGQSDFTCRANAENHFQKTHGKKSSQQPVQSAPIEVPQRSISPPMPAPKYVCCGIPFENRGSMIRHIDRRHFQQENRGQQGASRVLLSSMANASNQQKQPSFMPNRMPRL